MNHPGIIGVPTTNCTNQQYCGTKALIELVKAFRDGTHEGREVEKGKHEVEIVEVTIYEVEHEVPFRELEPYCRGLEYRSKTLETQVSYEGECSDKNGKYIR